MGQEHFPSLELPFLDASKLQDGQTEGSLTLAWPLSGGEINAAALLSGNSFGNESGGFSAGLLALIQKTAADVAHEEIKHPTPHTAGEHPDDTKFSVGATKKKTTEKQRRLQINTKFEELSELLNVPKDFKKQKLQILTMAVDELRRAKRAGFVVGSTMRTEEHVAKRRKTSELEDSDSGEELPVPQIKGMLDELDGGIGSSEELVKEALSLSGMYSIPNNTFGGFSGVFQTLASGPFDGLASEGDQERRNETTNLSSGPT